MRKVLFHALTICDLGIFHDSLHIIAAECRVATEQFKKILNTDERRLDIQKLSRFVHPSPQLLMQRQSVGGLAAENSIAIAAEKISILSDFSKYYFLSLLSLAENLDGSSISECIDTLEM